MTTDPMKAKNPIESLPQDNGAHGRVKQRVQRRNIPFPRDRQKLPPVGPLDMFKIPAVRTDLGAMVAGATRDGQALTLAQGRCSFS